MATTKNRSRPLTRKIGLGPTPRLTVTLNTDMRSVALSCPYCGGRVRRIATAEYLRGLRAFRCRAARCGRDFDLAVSLAGGPRKRSATGPEAPEKAAGETE